MKHDKSIFQRAWRLLREIRSIPKGVLVRRHVVGLALCISIFGAGFVIHGNIGLFFNLAGMLIVLGGTFGAALIAFRFERLEIVGKVLLRSLRCREKTPEEIVQILVDLSVKSKVRGLLSLEEDEAETTLLFLRRALGLLVDGFPAAQMRDILNTEIYYFRLRRDESVRVLRVLAEICPSFGLVGSVVGLVAMLAGVGDTAVILKTVPVALTSTLYGVVFANFLFSPLSARIQERTDRELLLQKIVLEGVIAIDSNLHPRILEKKLKSFLTPSSRKGRLVSLKRIQEKFHIHEDFDRQSSRGQGIRDSA